MLVKIEDYRGYELFLDTEDSLYPFKAFEEGEKLEFSIFMRQPFHSLNYLKQKIDFHLYELPEFKGPVKGSRFKGAGWPYQKEIEVHRVEKGYDNIRFYIKIKEKEVGIHQGGLEEFFIETEESLKIEEEITEIDKQIGQLNSRKKELQDKFGTITKRTLLDELRYLLP